MKRFLPLVIIISLFCLPITTHAKVNLPIPTITAGPITGNISACEGSSSVSPNIQQFTVSGSGLTTDITVTSPADFEVSLNPGNGYGSSVTLTQLLGTVGPTIVYVRSAASAPAGNLAENVVLTSTGAATQNVVTTGIVSAVSTVNAVGNQFVDNGYSTAPVSFSGTAANTFTWVNNTPGIGLPASGIGDISSFIGINTGITPITATITVTSNYAGFAYVANTSSDTISVINTLTQNVVASISGVGVGPRGVAVSPDGSRVYVASSSSNTVSVINATTNTVISTFSAGVSNPSGIAVSPNGSIVYVTNYLFNNVSVLNAVNNAVLAIIPVGQNPFAVAVSPDGSKVYVGNLGTNTVSVINAITNTQVAVVTVGLSPQGIAISPDGSTVYVTNLNSNSVSVINTTSNTVVANIPVGINPFGVTISPNGNTVYVANSSSNTISAINTATNTVIGTIPVGTSPFGVSVTPDGNTVYVTNYNSNDVYLISTLSNTVSKTVKVGSNPFSLGNFITGSSVCIGAPVKFTITVNPTPTVIIPNTFTPNGDGINDTWNLKYIESYPNCIIQIYNRYGTKVFFSNGYPAAWNGKYKGANVPDGTYYYVINLDSKLKPLGGHVTVIR
jgi:gliding motility-associated-like protein